MDTSQNANQLPNETKANDHSSQPTLDRLTREVASLKDMMDAMYLPKTVEQATQRIGRVDQNLKQIELQVSQCYNIIFILFLIVLSLMLCVAYMIWRAGYFLKPKNKQNIIPLKSGHGRFNSFG